jgi:hypothetical protein
VFTNFEGQVCPGNVTKESPPQCECVGTSNCEN